MTGVHIQYSAARAELDTARALVLLSLHFRGQKRAIMGIVLTILTTVVERRLVFWHESTLAQ